MIKTGHNKHITFINTNISLEHSLGIWTLFPEFIWGGGNFNAKQTGMTTIFKIPIKALHKDVQKSAHN